MPVNPGYEYVAAEKKYLNAQTMDERIVALEEMIKTAPKHKSSENLLAGLRSRLKKFLEKKEKSKKVGKTTQKAIKKEGFQVVLLGLPNSGKSSLLSKLTNAKPYISNNTFSTKHPEVGSMNYQGVKAQIVDLPPIGSDYFDSGIVNTADLIIVTLVSIDDLPKINPFLAKTLGKVIIVVTKSDLLSSEEIRKLEEKIKSKKLNAIITSNITLYNIEKLKEQIFKAMNVIRIYMKEPGKPHSNIPAVLPTGSTLKDAAESIHNGFYLKVRETRITGPSSKFPNQKVGLSHVLKDRDIIEFHTR